MRETKTVTVKIASVERGKPLPVTDPNCPLCHGAGIVTDYVDYGDTSVPVDAWCECVGVEDSNESV